jgi:hypothetical protein
MSESSRQAYLERARATLAAREVWRSVFEPQPVPLEPGCSEPAHPSTEAGPRTTPSPPADAESLCDKSDKSDQRASAAAGDDEEVAWRVEAMRGQVPVTGTIPILLARPEARLAPRGTCLSCGDPLSDGQRIRCVPCVRAVERVLYEVRECNDDEGRRVR